MAESSLFSSRLLTWYKHHGRFDLPWQQDRSLYRVWISEVMLQQTQVATVIPYFERFMQSYKDSNVLASASVDDVLLHWAGLGYYTRARNLHKAALCIRDEHDGKFPTKYDDVLALPGIGPSTAGAILAQATGQRHAILDGNVKRVLARHQAIEGWPGKPVIEKQLWQLAETYTPDQHIADYTQAIMDLGATLCKRSSPQCNDCPLQKDCRAYQSNRIAEFPGKKPKKTLPIRQKRLLIIRNENGELLMEKRPPTGIWGGLWSLPELAMDQPVNESVQQNWQLKVSYFSDLSMFRHTFSHFHLDITPCEVKIVSSVEKIADEGSYQWKTDLNQLALAAPVTKLLNIEK